MIDSPSDLTLAVVIPLFNKNGAIESTLRSVFAQTRLPNELIIVDDGSTDRSVVLARRALADCPASICWTVLEQPHAGVSAARNRGVDASKSDYVAFLDADDEWLSECMREFDNLVRAFPSAGLLSVRLAKRDRGVIVPEPSALPPHFFGIVRRPLDVYRRGYGILSSSSVVLSRAAWHRSGGFPEAGRRGEDIYLWLKILMAEPFAHSSRPLSIWRDHYSGATSRTGAVPVHLGYFLGTPDGARKLAYPGLRDFLQSNLLVQIVTMRLLGDDHVARELTRLAARCSLLTRVRCVVALYAPHPILRVLTWCIKRLRRSVP
jgi:glycosyltransferase involved in cell wall biosynthesis